MADTTLRDFPRRSQEFIHHWKSLNATRSGSPVVVSDGYDVETLEKDREAFLRLSEEIIAVENSEREQINAVDRLRGPQRERITQLKASVGAFLAGSLYIKQLPALPGKLASQEVYRRACDDAAEVWMRLDNDATLPIARPLLLPGEIARARFVADTQALLSAWDSLLLQRQRLKTLRRERDTLVRRASLRLTRYRKAVLATLTGGHALLATLPT